MSDPRDKYVSRAGAKLAPALAEFGIQPVLWVCADLGSNVGGFVDCLLQHGAAKVYAIDTGYGTLAWNLRRDPRVVVMERTNAMHASLPEPVNLVTIDVAWTRQRHILPAAARLVKPEGRVLTLVKPHYEAPREWLRKGVLEAGRLDEVVQEVREMAEGTGWAIRGQYQSPLPGQGGNREVWLLLALQPPSGKE